jgi:hypothetical protein
MPRACKPENGFRFIINLDDHTPSHVHVYKAGELAIFFLGSKRKLPRLRKKFGMKDNEVHRALLIICRRQKEMLKKWREIHGHG